MPWMINKLNGSKMLITNPVHMDAFTYKSKILSSDDATLAGGDPTRIWEMSPESKEDLKKFVQDVLDHKITTVGGNKIVSEKFFDDKGNLTNNALVVFTSWIAPKEEAEWGNMMFDMKAKAEEERLKKIEHETEREAEIRVNAEIRARERVEAIIAAQKAEAEAAKAKVLGDQKAKK